MSCQKKDGRGHACKGVNCATPFVTWLHLLTMKIVSLFNWYLFYVSENVSSEIEMLHISHLTFHSSQSYLRGIRLEGNTFHTWID